MSRRLAPLLVLLLTGCGTAPATAPAPEPADLVLTNGAIYTVDASRPWAQAVAVRGGRLVAVGTDAEAVALVGPATRRVDLGGRFVTAHSTTRTCIR